MEHDVYATAHTRAKNRAISDLVGGGEVSAEEMLAMGGALQKQRKPKPVDREPEQPQGRTLLLTQEESDRWKSTIFDLMKSKGIENPDDDWPKFWNFLRRKGWALKSGITTNQAQWIIDKFDTDIWSEFRKK